MRGYNQNQSDVTGLPPRLSIQIGREKRPRINIGGNAMLVSDVMTRDVEVIRPEDTLIHAAQRMKQLDVGSLPVCDGRRVVGMLTDRDITVVATAEGTDPAETPVGDVMTPDVVFCFADEDVQQAANLMEEKKVRRVMVMDRKKRLVGLVSIGDLAEKNRNKTLTGEVLEKVSEPTGAEPKESPMSDTEKSKIEKQPSATKVPEIPAETHL
jgi:CBS domain-containing protein